MRKEERERRRERLRIFANNNQWIKKKDLEQTLEEMSAQLREYRRDLQQIRMQEAATEAKIDKLQNQVNAIEESLRLTKQPKQEESSANKQTLDIYNRLDTDRDGYSVPYSEQGLEQEEHKSTITLYA